MAIATSFLAFRWSREISGINEANSFSISTLASRANIINAAYTSFGSQREVVDGLYGQFLNVQNDLLDWTQYLATLLGTTLQTMARDDSARPATDDLIGWFDKLYRDMTAQSHSFQRPTVSGSVSLPGTNIGDGYMLQTTIDPVDGIATYYAFGEVIRLECTAASYDGSTNAGEEVFSMAGETAVGEFDPLWPKGSGAAGTLTALTPDSAGILTDGSVENWTVNTPQDWSISGTAGTHIFKGTSSPYTVRQGDLFYVSMLGTASDTRVGIYQNLDQTNALIKANTNYAVQCWVKTPAAGHTAATFRISLEDDALNILTDNAGATQSLDTAFGTLNGYTSWTRVATVLRTPRNLPATIRLFLGFPSGASRLESGQGLYVDYITLAEMEQAYPGGPYLSIISGDTPFSLKDAFIDTISQSAGGMTFVRNLDRYFGLARNKVRLLTATSPTVSDGLIT